MFFHNLNRLEWPDQLPTPSITNAFVSMEASSRHKLSDFSFPASANFLFQNLIDFSTAMGKKCNLQFLVNLPVSYHFTFFWYANMQRTSNRTCTIQQQMDLFIQRTPSLMDSPLLLLITEQET